MINIASFVSKMKEEKTISLHFADFSPSNFITIKFCVQNYVTDRPYVWDTKSPKCPRHNLTVKSST